MAWNPVLTDIIPSLRRFKTSHNLRKRKPQLGIQQAKLKFSVEVANTPGIKARGLGVELKIAILQALDSQIKAIERTRPNNPDGTPYEPKFRIQFEDVQGPGSLEISTTVQLIAINELLTPRGEAKLFSLRGQRLSAWKNENRAVDRYAAVLNLFIRNVEVEFAKIVHQPLPGDERGENRSRPAARILDFSCDFEIFPVLAWKFEQKK